MKAHKNIFLHHGNSAQPLVKEIMFKITNIAKMSISYGKAITLALTLYDLVMHLKYLTTSHTNINQVGNWHSHSLI